MNKTKTPESRLRANQKWQSANYKNIRLTLNVTTDSDIIEWMDKQPNKLQYIKQLIRADIAKNK